MNVNSPKHQAMSKVITWAPSTLKAKGAQGELEARRVRANSGAGRYICTANSPLDAMWLARRLNMAAHYENAGTELTEAQAKAITADVGANLNAASSPVYMMIERGYALGVASRSQPLPNFATAWKRYEDKGYRYGEDALEQVRFGYRIALEELATTRPTGPNFDVVRDKRMSELTPEQRDDARELWLREQIGWTAPYYRDHLEFLFKRLDEARGTGRQVTAQGRYVQVVVTAPGTATRLESVNGVDPDMLGEAVDGMELLGRYNWKNQPERLIYLGRKWSGNGFWHRFSLVDKPNEVWCEVLHTDLHMIEKTEAV